MQSRWFHLKPKAIALRKKGNSLRTIEQSLKIPRSTLSGWLSTVELTEVQKANLKETWRGALVDARKKAVVWHNEQKSSRLKEAEDSAEDVLSRVDTSNGAILDVALAMLYLGEGFKKVSDTGIGNSDPLVLNFFLAVIQKIYGLDITKIRCHLHLRADQDPEEMKGFWSKKLNLPLANFTYVTRDERTRGVPTYPHYKGVCLLRCGNVAIQRKLVYLSQKFCEKIVKDLRA